MTTVYHFLVPYYYPQEKEDWVQGELLYNQHDYGKWDARNQVLTRVIHGRVYRYHLECAANQRVFEQHIQGRCFKAVVEDIQIPQAAINYARSRVRGGTHLLC